MTKEDEVQRLALIAQQQATWHKEQKEQNHCSERLKAVANCLNKDSNGPIQ